jgi:ABC-type nitrate/sulfonate/bicarbonate transport system permease component
MPAWLGFGSLGTLLDVVSVTDLTTQAAWMAGLAILALALAGWRKTARATARTPRGESILRRQWEPVPIAETTTTLYKRPGPVRRLVSALAGSALAIMIGAVLAVVIAFSIGYLVITLTDLLKQ